jgi:hypothetical protein
VRRNLGEPLIDWPPLPQIGREAENALFRFLHFQRPSAVEKANSFA